MRGAHLIRWLLLAASVCQPDAILIKTNVVAVTAKEIPFEANADATAAERLVLRLAPTTNERPILTVELLNGLGNQLFQVATLLSVALDANFHFSVALPDVDHLSSKRIATNRSTYWHSVMRKLRPLLRDPRSDPGESIVHDACAVQQVPHFDPVDRNCSHATAYESGWSAEIKENSHGLACNRVILRGYFQNAAFFATHLQLLRQIFWDESSVGEAEQRLVSLAKGHKGPMVSLHYRLTDYEPSGLVLPEEYYENAVVAVRRHLKGDLLCLIFSDDSSRAWSRSESVDACDKRVLVPSSESDVVSFYMMSLVEASVIADSTFSYFAAVLAPSKKIVVAPQILGPRSGCWSYLQANPGKLTWLTLPTEALSPGALLLEEMTQSTVVED